MLRRRLARRSVAFYLTAFVALLFLTDMLLSQYPTSSRRNSYLASVSNVVTAVNEISNMEKVVLPNQSTVILEPSPSVTCQNSGDGLFLLIVVISSPDNVERREAIRSTFNEMEPKWKEKFNEIKANSKNVSEQLEVDRVFQTLFFVGQSAEHGMSDAVREEWERHGDVIVDDLQESYLKLTVKTLRMLKWVFHNCANAKYVVKMDDDVFLNMPRLLSFLLTQPNGYNPLLIAGHVYKEVQPDRDSTSKWFTPRSVWAGDHLPSFTAGFCYILGMKAAQGMFEESKNIPLFHLEDVYLTGIVATDRLKYELTDPGGILTLFSWFHYITKTTDYPLNMLVIHQVPVKQFRCWTKNTDHDAGQSWTGFAWPLMFSCWW